MISKNNKKILFVFLTLIIIGILVILIWNLTSLKITAPTNIVYNKSTNTVFLDSLTLKQKIAQMIITTGKENNKDILQNMLIGGIHLGKKNGSQEFISIINDFQEGATIPFFVATDLEGHGNPFESFQHFPSLLEIKDEEEAYTIGYKEGKLLKSLGFSINFAPVLDLNDTIWNGRSFTGTPKEISAKAVSYINGLQSQGILATAKHYPGKTLSIKDPHTEIVHATINEDDLLPFKEAIKNNVSAIMVSHVIVNGSVSSEAKPSSVSEQLITSLRESFDGLIITDEINMAGLKSYYSDTEELYIDLFKVDSDLIITINSDPKEIYNVICIVEQAVKKGLIDKARINQSVSRILKAKGINIK